MAKMSNRSIQDVLAEYTSRWLEIPGVVGTAISECDGRECITIFAGRKSEALAARLPESVDGHRVCVLEIGEIDAI